MYVIYDFDLWWLHVIYDYDLSSLSHMDLTSQNQWILTPHNLQHFVCKKEVFRQEYYSSYLTWWLFK